MNEEVLRDSIQQITAKTLSETEAINDTTSHMWLWVALFEFVVIIFLLISRKGKSKVTDESKFKQEAREGNVDFDNIINSSFHVKPLYDELKVKCHPDRFPTDSNKNKIALELFQEITKNKTNYKKLSELKQDAEVKLEIKFLKQ